MGTRHLTMVVLNGEYKVAQYGQWDGYFSGQGKTIANFLIKNKERLGEFIEKVRDCTWTTREYEAEINETAKKTGFLPEELSRDTGAEILDIVLNRGPLKLVNNLKFAKDSMFCEFAYVINLDNQTLELYKGFNKSHLSPSERFFGLVPSKDSDYKSVKHFKTFPFSEVSCELMDSLDSSEEDKE